MALLEDTRKKPVNIYAKGTPTVKAQGLGVEAWKKAGTTLRNTGQSMANFADKNLGGAGARQIISGVGGVASAFADDVHRNNVARGVRRGTLPYGDAAARIDNAHVGMENRQFGVQSPVQVGDKLPEQTQEGAPGAGMGVEGPQMYGPTIDPRNRQVLLTNVGGDPNGRVEGDVEGHRQFVKKSRQAQAMGVNPDGSRRVGNMDVTFGPGVSAEAQAAFLRDPVRPSAQIARGVRRPARFIKPDYSGGKDDGEIKTFGDILNVKRGMAERRLAQGDRRLDQADQTIENQGRGLDLQARGVDINQFNALVNAETADFQNRRTEQEIESGGLGLDRDRMVAELEKEYSHPETTPERRKTIERQLYAYRGKQQPVSKIEKVTTVNPDLSETERFVRIAPDGSSAEYISPSYSKQQLTEYVRMLDGMKPDDAKAWVKDLKTTEPGLYNNLRAYYHEIRPSA